MSKRKVSRNKTKRRPLSDDQKRAIAKTRFKKKIVDFFCVADFLFINTENKGLKFGPREIEIDAVFVYENIILICEDTTTSTDNIKDHIRTKYETFGLISGSFREYYEWLVNEFPEKKDCLTKYEPENMHYYFLYFSKEPTGLTKDLYDYYKIIRFIEPSTFDYFSRMQKCIQKSVRYEIFRFLGVTINDLGELGSSTNYAKVIKAPILHSNSVTGYSNGVRVVSFMMSAEQLISMSYVLRKDNWEDSIYLYQRLINPDKIKKIRTFLSSNKVAFLNNIIVGLPDGVKLIDTDDKEVPFAEASGFENLRLLLPEQMNSICIIDGQHRIYAHYEGRSDDKSETEISKLRKKLHFLVTGLVFPSDMNDNERKRIQSEIFLDINSQATPVSKNVLTHIMRLKYPLSSIGIARRVIERMNEQGCFQNKFAVSGLEETKIKIASIIQFALNYLVTIEPSDGKKSMYEYWDGDKEKLCKLDEEQISCYVNFCASNLSMYFSAIKTKFKLDWLDPKSRIFSVTAINGFIIAYNRLLSVYGVQDFNFYKNILSSLNVDFTPNEFPFKSSQYHKFADLIISQIDVGENPPSHP